MYGRIAIASLVAGVAAAAPAGAQTCDNRDRVVGQLEEVYDENMVAAGMHDGQHLVELWATEDGRTWTLLLSRADGHTCILASGADWTGYIVPEMLAGVEG